MQSISKLIEREIANGKLPLRKWLLWEWKRINEVELVMRLITSLGYGDKYLIWNSAFHLLRISVLISLVIFVSSCLLHNFCDHFYISIEISLWKQNVSIVIVRMNGIYYRYVSMQSLLLRHFFKISFSKKDKNFCSIFFVSATILIRGGSRTSPRRGANP